MIYFGDWIESPSPTCCGKNSTGRVTKHWNVGITPTGIKILGEGNNPTGIKTVGRIAPVGLQILGTYRHNPDRYYNCGKNSTGRVTCSIHTLDMFMYIVGRLCAVCYVVNHRTGSTFCHCSHRWFLATQKIDTVVRENLSINFGSDISVALASQRKIPQHVATKGHRILPLDVISWK